MEKEAAFVAVLVSLQKMQAKVSAPVIVACVESGEAGH